MEIKIRDNKFILLPQKAIYWIENNSVLISDLHLGKIMHFRREGIAVPSNAVYENYKRLNEIINEYTPEEIFFIGDLFHSIENEEWKLFEDWRKKHAQIGITLILGNHDMISAEAIEKFDLKIYSKEMSIGSFMLSHKPLKKTKEDKYVFSGHVHPVFKLRGNGNQKLKFPCFYFTATQGILPSFGYFTGGFEIKPEENSRLVIVAGNQVKEVF